MFLFLFVTTLLAVDRSKYSQCNEVKFCQRNRFVQKQKWETKPDSIFLDNNMLKIPLFSDITKSTVLLNLEFLLNSCVHVKITNFSIENTSKNVKRYDCSLENSIVNQTILKNRKKIDFLNNNSNYINKTHIVIKVDHHENQFRSKVVIQIKPFCLFVYENENDLKLSLNEDDTMIFETSRVENQYTQTNQLITKSNKKIKKSDNDDYYDYSNDIDDENDEETLNDSIDDNLEIDNELNPSIGDHLNNDVKMSVAASFSFYDKNIKFSGLPSHTLPLNLPNTIDGEPIRFYNTDINSFEVNSGMAMYGSIPYIVGHSGAKSTSLFWCNPCETWVDINNNNVRFISETNYIDFFVFTGTHQSVIKEYSDITGRIQMQQMFTFGYHQCRWTYYTSDEIRKVTKKLDKNMIPHDVMWLDLDHTNDKMYFTFNKDYQDILKLTNEIVSNQRRLVAQVDPHLKAIESYRIYKEAKDRNFLIYSNSDKEIFFGNCWPGRSAWIDFMNPNARVWWAKQFNYSLYNGSSKFLFVWNDMNEPAVFDVKDFTLPKTAIHFRNFEDRNVHNLYGHFMVMSSYNGLLKRNINNNVDNTLNVKSEEEVERVFLLTRSFFAGSQKYSLMWTGDNTASWEQLKASIWMTLSLSVSNFPISGSDVGGFFNSPDQELLARWYQLGAFVYPFFRCHCHHLSDRREPYTLTGNFYEMTKNAIQERYSLLPLWYTLMKENIDTANPIVRPIWYEINDNHDHSEFSNINDEVMIGDTLLVAPIVSLETSQKNEREILFPRNHKFYDFRTLEEISFTDSNNKVTVKSNMNVPCYIRSGKILFLKPTLRKSSEAMFHDPFKIIVCLDDQQQSKGTIYIDDGHTFNYKKGEFLYKLFHFQENVLSSENLQNDINFSSKFFQSYSVKINEIIIVGLQRIPKEIIDQKNNQKIKFTVNKGKVHISKVNLVMKEDISLKFVF
ncbi:Neutral alpha-glucosidase AB [Tritrichomonas foetus]|uniref:Glucosidase II subunit alpha n=1 Tax=Tritrichomonas foetus TaxID=1144522 RepID=A0A1J4JH13_9EUKA|nr:Neutral alpha-glucosidase AB [Tritrichomonas foetus]|eukprot:OHS97985.1 Neutral alpha-glucosidase AB [Tritrichomonas foetus]